MATPGQLQLQLASQTLGVVLGDGNLARVGSVVTMAVPPGPLIDTASGVEMKWTITGIIYQGPLNVLVTGGPVTNTLSAAVNGVRALKLVSF